MRRDRLVLLLLLTGFALLGAECRLVHNESDDERLPARAAPASALLRTYFNTVTTPAKMTDIKIPEDKDLLKREGPLEIKFDMGGGTVVNDVRCRLRISPPEKTSGADCDIQCRIRHPNGTRSGWKDVDFAVGDLLDPQVEIVFLNEFDGLDSGGTWVIELQDSIDDNDGRCVFRNGTLRINLGEAAGLGGNFNETALLAITSPSYTYIPEVNGGHDLGDWGKFGFVNNTLKAQFTFTSPSFFVRSFALRFTILRNESVSPEEDLYAILISPSGGWVAFPLAGDNVLASLNYGSQVIETYGFGSTSTGVLGPSFEFRGEPSNGTWTLCLWDVNINSNIAFLAKDMVEKQIIVGPDGDEEVTVEVLDTPAQLSLGGVS